MIHHFLAVDLGAESGRVILGSLISGKLTWKEIHRFPNGMLQIQGKCYWNVGNLYSEILKGIEICVQKEKTQPESIGIDTWGVDFGLLTKDGTLMGLPFAYRDSRIENAVEEVTSLIGKEEIYQLTGTHCAPYNTLFQLYGAKKHHPELINGAADLLFIPDLLTYFLTGEKKTEFSFATTSQLFNPLKKRWEERLFDVLDIPVGIMQEVIEPGTVIGYIEDNICKLTGINKIPVIAVATHDTNSAIAAIPGKGNWAYISTGTWSLIGIERPNPLVNKDSFLLNFTNEGGVCQTFNFLKNHMGLWQIQQCKKIWKDKNYSYTSLIEMANDAEEFVSFIDVDNLSFLNPENMCVAINDYCNRTNQKVYTDEGQVVRIILESLALKYRESIDQIIELTSEPIDEIFMTGGGTKNNLLCQFTANATGRRVKVVLAEGASVGNLLMQALALGYVKSLGEIRTIVENGSETITYEPARIDDWDRAFKSYKKITSSY